MSSKSTTKELLKKTYRITQAEQSIIDRMMKNNGFKTESALLSHLLGTYERLEEITRNLGLQLRQQQEENGRKAAIMRRFNMALSELMAEQLDHHAEPKQSRHHVHITYEEE